MPIPIDNVSNATVVASLNFEYQLNRRTIIIRRQAEPETPAWKEVQRHAVDDHVQIEKLTRASAPIRIGDTTVRVLAPAADYVPGDTAENNDSLVFRLSFGKRSILFTGDAERQVEQELLQDDCLEPVTVLKVGHHGSRTSSSEDFIERLSPQFALIMVGILCRPFW